MFDVQFEKLTMTDRDNFARVVNQLLAHTFLPVDTYDTQEGVTRVNKDYLFVERNFELFQDYFSYAGFRLERDSGYGVIYLTSGYEGNRARFDKITTLIVYALRLIYEEEREKLTLTKEVIITTGDLVHKLINLGVFRRKPANAALHSSLVTLSKFRIIEKLEGVWEAADTRFLILPTILFVVSNEQISNMYRLIDDGSGQAPLEGADTSPDEEAYTAAGAGSAAYEESEAEQEDEYEEAE